MRFRAAICFIGLMLISLAGMAQESPSQSFEQANQALQAGDVEQALAQYVRLAEGPHQAGALFLNMGISYVRLDSMGKAKYYFLKARQFPETQPQAAEALQYVEKQFSRQSAVLPTLPWQQAINWVQQHVGAVPLLALGVVLFNLGIFVIIGGWFWGLSPRSLRPLAFIIIVLGLVGLGSSFFIDYQADRYRPAVMVQAETPVRQQPDAEAAVVNQAYEGYALTVDRSESVRAAGWSYVRMSNGQYGWLRSEKIMIL